ncbi:MAG: glycoside hydrolase family 18 protein [Bacillota bacterium]|nr:glycoside hydrolase family 18 protein [Bacillota bacterium]
MKIHVVSSGESPYSIARQYGVDVNKLISANGLDQIPHLVVGQSIVVPGIGATYTLRPGETIYSVAVRYGVTPQSIIEASNITNPTAVAPGTVLVIPEKPKKYGVIETNGFIIPSTPERETPIVNEAAPYLTYISPFSHQVTETAGLAPLDDQNIINTAKKFRTAPLLSVTNISSATGGFNTELINRILTNDQLQTTLINNIMSLVQQKGYYGVIVDFERISPENREAYNNFLRKLAARLHPNYILATALAPKTSDVTEGAWHGAHDYRAHGQIADFVILMTYEWGWSGGPPLAVAPLNEVRKVIEYAISVIPPKKIMMGIPLYGYDWTLPYTPRSEYAKAVGYIEAVDIAARNNASIRYDAKSSSPFFNYTDGSGRQHVVWFEDVRSLYAKYLLVNELGLRGTSYWALGKPAPMNWYLLDSMFTITKVIP